jgi:hypothetical protein
VEIYLLPLDLARWDQSVGGDLFVIPVWSDVRPLRGAAGLVDWRLNGRLSECLREERFTGTLGERLLLPTRRLPWRAVLALGLGNSSDFDETRFHTAIETTFTVLRGLGLQTVATAFPGRESGRLAPERAVGLFQQSAHAHADVTALTLIDTPAALKVMGELLGLTTAARAVAKASP